MTTTTAPSILDGLEAQVLEPAQRELDAIRRELRGIDPTSADETAAVAERLHGWGIWGDLEIYLSRAVGRDAWANLPGSIVFGYANGRLAFELAILGLPRMLEPAPEEPADDLADAIGAWYHRLRSELRDMAGSMEATAT